MDHDDTTALTTELTNQIFYNDGDTLFFLREGVFNKLHKSVG